MHDRNSITLDLQSAWWYYWTRASGIWYKTIPVTQNNRCINISNWPKKLPILSILNTYANRSGIFWKQLRNDTSPESLSIIITSWLNPWESILPERCTNRQSQEHEVFSRPSAAIPRLNNVTVQMFLCLWPISGGVGPENPNLPKHLPEPRQFLRPGRGGR